MSHWRGQSGVVYIVEYAYAQQHNPQTRDHHLQHFHRPARRVQPSQHLRRGGSAGAAKELRRLVKIFRPANFAKEMAAVVQVRGDSPCAPQKPQPSEGFKSHGPTLQATGETSVFFTGKSIPQPGMCCAAPRKVFSPSRASRKKFCRTAMHNGYLHLSSGEG